MYTKYCQKLLSDSGLAFLIHTVMWCASILQENNRKSIISHVEADHRKPTHSCIVHTPLCAITAVTATNPTASSQSAVIYSTYIPCSSRIHPQLFFHLPSPPPPSPFPIALFRFQPSLTLSSSNSTHRFRPSLLHNASPTPSAPTSAAPRSLFCRLDSITSTPSTP